MGDLYPVQPEGPQNTQKNQCFDKTCSLIILCRGVWKQKMQSYKPSAINIQTPVGLSEAIINSPFLCFF